MIHLFGKLYITYAEWSVGPDSIEKVSENYIQIIGKNLTVIDHHTFGKNRLYYTKTLYELLESFDSESQFFEIIHKKLNDHYVNKIIIYADEIAFVELLMRWWKTIFPKLKVDGAQALYRNFADSEMMQQSKKQNFLNISVDSSQIPFKHLANLYWGKSNQEIEGLFHCYEPFDFDLRILKDCSLEFKVIDYIRDSHTPYLGFLIKKLAILYKKAFMHEICGAKRSVERNLYHLNSDLNELNEVTRLNSKSLWDFISNHSDYKFLTDSNIKVSVESYNYISDTYNLDSICKTLIELDVKIHQKLGFPDRDILLYLDNPIITSYSESKKHPELLSILEKEFTGESKFQIFKNLVKKNKINPFIISAFYNSKQNSDKNDFFINQFELIWEDIHE